jgi:hypothetical protein
MKALQALTWVSLGVAALAMIGCRHGRVVIREDGPPPPEYVIVREAPPPLVVEARVPAPAPDHVWIEGYWHWGGHRYEWMRGHWERPPHAHAVWVPAHYERRHDDWVYTRGRWETRRR